MATSIERAARLTAFAKINLGLRVLRRREDGYHELRTVFQTISLADRLDLAFTPGRTTSIEVLGTPHIPDNLAGRAARLVLEKFGKSGRVQINLDKKTPTGAGLGGGSSDAAAVLLALPVLAGIRASIDQLAELGASLGSDVPFFLYGGTALGLGRGEELYPLPDQPARPLLLITPTIHSSTAEAYRDLSATLANSGDTKVAAFQRAAWSRNLSPIVNDFEPVVFRRHPELAAIRKRLLSLGAVESAMSGSGSSVFGLFDSTSDLRKAQSAWDRRATPAAPAHAVSFVSGPKFRSVWRRALNEHRSNDDQLWPPQSRHAR